MYVILVYLITFAVIVWAGPSIYLTMLGSLKPRCFVRGLWVGLLAVAVVQAILINFAGRHLSPTAQRLEGWCPLLLHCWCRWKRGGEATDIAQPQMAIKRRGGFGVRQVPFGREHPFARL
jgi:hypothetical protein